MSLNLEHQLKLMNDAVHASVRFMQRDFGEMVQLQNSKRGVEDFSRKSYIRIGNKISEALSEKRPDFGIVTIGQELPKNKGYFYVIEPISGLNNFQHSIPFCCLTVALFSEEKNEALAISIHNPILRETFYAAKGVGSWFENYTETVIPKSRMRVSGQNSLKSALIVAPHHPNIFPSSQNFGCEILELAYLSAGRIDVVINQSKNILSDAALIMVKEAGGEVEIKEKEFIASNNLLKNQIDLAFT